MRKPALADRVASRRPEEVLRVALADAGRVPDLPDRAERGAPQLMPREVLLDLLLQRGGQLDPGLLAEADLDISGSAKLTPTWKPAS